MTVFVLGVLMSVTGAIIEAVAVIAMVSYRLRTTLPVDSPINLQTWGGICFCAGVGCAVFGRWLSV
ncbi:MAG: hypothetical protein P4L84_28845 [Isosphaeraceae bacterium]|nr:hypothetical protein [Isosphaeraceae bacterium]